MISNLEVWHNAAIYEKPYVTYGNIKLSYVSCFKQQLSCRKSLQYNKLREKHDTYDTYDNNYTKKAYY